MGVTILIGGQYGSEGKGKIAGYLAGEFNMSIRTGGPNSGHTVEYNGRLFKQQSVPCAFVNSSCLLAIGAGGIIDVETLNREIKDCGIQPGRLIIDPQIAVIDREHVEAEQDLKSIIGSTGKGVGAAIAAKTRRYGGIRLARDITELQEYLGDVAQTANNIIDSGGQVFLEGAQGFGLSLHHGNYPFVTGHDTSAGTLCGEAGISPRLVTDIIMAIRTYPIRVGGNSGPIGDEIDWETVTRESGSPKPVIEETTVTKRVRRVARFDIEQVKRAVLINRPTQLALTFVDYLDYSNREKRAVSDLTGPSLVFVDMIERETGIPVTLIGTGPGSHDIIDLRKSKLG